MPEMTLSDIESAIRASWSIETCDPADVPNWTDANPASGQCAVTALVVRDLIGGQLLEAEVHFPDGTRQGFHYWNRLDGIDVDLTREQFIQHEIVLEPKVVAGPPTVEWIVDRQYKLFRQRVYAALGRVESSPDAP